MNDDWTPQKRDEIVARLRARVAKGQWVRFGGSESHSGDPVPGVRFYQAYEEIEPGGTTVSIAYCWNRTRQKVLKVSEGPPLGPPGPGAMRTFGTQHALEIIESMLDEYTTDRQKCHGCADS